MHVCGCAALMDRRGHCHCQTFKRGISYASWQYWKFQHFTITMPHKADKQASQQTGKKFSIFSPAHSEASTLHIRGARIGVRRRQRDGATLWLSVLRWTFFLFLRLNRNAALSNWATLPLGECLYACVCVGKKERTHILGFLRFCLKFGAFYTLGARRIHVCSWGVACKWVLRVLNRQTASRSKFAHLFAYLKWIAFS